jgi:hypothetical protein
VSSEFLDASRKHAGREAGQAGFEILKSPRRVKKQVPQEKDGPAIADDIEGARDGAAHGVLSRQWDGPREFYLIVVTILYQVTRIKSFTKMPEEYGKNNAQRRTQPRAAEKP